MGYDHNPAVAMPQEIGIPSNAIAALPPMSWRNLDTPAYVSAGISGGNTLAEHHYPYIDSFAHDNMGRSSISMPFRFYFVNTVQRKSFPDLFSQWVEAVVFDTTPGKLLHPLLGELDAIVQTWSVELDAHVTSGVIMDVTWVETLLDPEAAQVIVGVPISIHDAARAADEAREKLKIEYPTGTRTTSLTDMVGQLDGLMMSTRLTFDGMINQALGFVGRLIEVMEHARDHTQWALVDVHKNLYSQIESLRTPAPRLTAVYVTTSSDTLDGVARLVGNTVGEIVTLNPELLGKPVIKTGSAVRYFTE